MTDPLALRPLPETPKYRRAPRRIAKRAEGEIAIEAPPAPEQNHRPPLRQKGCMTF